MDKWCKKISKLGLKQPYYFVCKKEIRTKNTIGMYKFSFLQPSILGEKVLDQLEVLCPEMLFSKQTQRNEDLTFLHFIPYPKQRKFYS